MPGTDVYVWYSQLLRRNHREVQVRPVGADDRQVGSGPKAQAGEAAGDLAHLGRDRAPAPGLPDAQILLAHGRRVRPRARMGQQKAGKSVCIKGHDGADCRPDFDATLSL